MLFIAFVSMVVLDGDLWHGGIVRSPGKVRFHADIIPTADAKAQAELAYINGDKQSLANIKVDYEQAIIILPREQTEDIKKLIFYITTTYAIGNSILIHLPS